jgi:hypothetical protein
LDNSVQDANALPLAHVSSMKLAHRNKFQPKIICNFRTNFNLLK